MADIKYVKFQRGTPEDYAKAKQLSTDTLYFISEKGSKDGKLYLGDKLIAGSSLGDLNDIVIDSEELDENTVLAFDPEENKWYAKSATDVLRDSSLIRIMKPATEDRDGLAGYVPQPLAGPKNRFLNSEGKWTEVVATISDTDKDEIIENLKNSIFTLEWGNF